MDFDFSDELYAKLKFACEYRAAHGKAAAEKLWMQLGLPIGPPIVQSQSGDERINRFLAECTVRSPGARTQSSELYRAFGEWCRSSGQTACSQKAFTMSMSGAGFRRVASNVIWFLDIRLIATATGSSRKGG